MEYRRLGRTELRVSVLGFGCGNVGGLMIRGSPAERERAVARAVEIGVNYFDTAPSYGDGLSERHLGQALRTLNAPVYVGTKFRLDRSNMVDVAEAIVRSLEASLKRLGMEHTDLLQLHNHVGPPRGNGALGVEEILQEVVPVLARLRQQGKTRFFGITGLGDAGALHRVIEAGALDTIQVCYNLLNPSAGMEVPPGFPAQNFGGLLTRAREQRMGVIGIRVLAAGALGGVAERHPIAAPAVDPLATGPDYAADVRRAEVLSVLVEEGHVQSLVEASVRFPLGNDAVSTVLVGYSSLEQLELAQDYASRGPLPRAVLQRLAALWNDLARRARPA